MRYCGIGLMPDALERSGRRPDNGNGIGLTPDTLKRPASGLSQATKSRYWIKCLKKHGGQLIAIAYADPKRQAKTDPDQNTKEKGRRDAALRSNDLVIDVIVALNG